MVAEGFNAAGVSALGGVAASCFAADDVTRNFGSQSGSFEGMLDTALDYAFEGTCLTAPLSKSENAGSVPAIYERILNGDIF